MDMVLLIAWIRIHITWGRDYVAAISQTTFWDAFSYWKYMNFVQDFNEVCQGSNLQYFRIGSDSGLAPTRWKAMFGAKLLSESMMLTLLTHICVTWPQRVKIHICHILEQYTCILRTTLCHWLLDLKETIVSMLMWVECFIMLNL